MPKLELMNRANLATVKKLPRGVATHRSIVVRGRPVWAWKPLSSLQRIDVQHATRSVRFDVQHFEKVLDAKSAGVKAVRREK